ncbi:unnamed protein product [Paramecium octaurelia]|uniref:Uncharacterized protein n=1 Tax=Paramecium octaurelia TaxID=43137 RepID=A0A8S1UFM4_PAROT|nr:unnamed protein product [Paramecium octaurelia]
MNDNYILLYGGVSGCFSEIVGNLSNFWQYTGHYHSANPFLCSSGLFKDWDQKMNFIQNRFLNKHEFKRLIKQLLHDVKWNSLTWCLRFYIKERSYRNIVKENSNGIQPVRYFTNKQVYFCILLYLVALLNFAAHLYFQYGTFLGVNNFLVSNKSLLEQYNLEHYLEFMTCLRVQ